MDTRKTTNILLALIFVAIVVMILMRLPVSELSAETLRLDSCITSSPYDKPEAYVHVIMHDVSPIQSPDKLR